MYVCVYTSPIKKKIKGKNIWEHVQHVSVAPISRHFFVCFKEVCTYVLLCTCGRDEEGKECVNRWEKHDPANRKRRLGLLT